MQKNQAPNGFIPP